MNSIKTWPLMMLSIILLIVLSACNGQPEGSFKIKFETFGGTKLESVLYDGTEVVSFPDDPTKKGYVFNGWYFDQGIFERPYSEEALANENIRRSVTLYAKWISQDIVFNDIDLKMNEFLDNGNQYEIELIVDLGITVDHQTETYRESITMLTQADPYYTSVTSGGITTVLCVQNDQLYRYTMNHRHVANGIQLYERQELSMSTLEDPLSDIEVDFSDALIAKTNENEYKVSGKMVDLMPKSMIKDLKEILLETGLTEDDFNDIEIELVYILGEESIAYHVEMNLNIDDIELVINVGVVMTHQSFDLVDFSDDTNYFPMSSYETQIPIDISKPIVFTADNYYMTSYYAYFEAGKYGLYQKNKEVEGLTFRITNENQNSTQLRVFNDVYNRYQENPDNITNFYEIPTDGYYFIAVEYPVAIEPYIIEIKKIDSVTDGIDTPTFVVTDSGGVFNYEIESIYDFVSFKFDLNQKAIISIVDDNSNYIYLNESGVSYFTSVWLPIEGLDFYMTDENSMFYIHNPEGPTSGTVSIKVSPMVHATQPDESMLYMDDEFSENYIITSPEFPSQYLGIEVTERKRYTFEFLVISGELDEVGGTIYRSGNSQGINIQHNTSLVLMPGSYYFKSFNDHLATYSIRAITQDIIETSYYIDSLETYYTVTGNLLEPPRFTGQINYDGEFIIYYFTLTETQDICFYGDNKFELYDSMSNRIDIKRLSTRFVYRLEAGDYFVRVNFQSYYSSHSFPVDYSLILFIFNGGAGDTSVYPFDEVVPFGIEGKTATMDYPGDYDGYIFTLTETQQVSFFTTDTAILLKDNLIYYSSLNSGIKTLPAGTYTVMCNTYYDTWTIHVRIIDSYVSYKHSHELLYHTAFIPKELIIRKDDDFSF